MNIVSQAKGSNTGEPSHSINFLRFLLFGGMAAVLVLVVFFVFQASEKAAMDVAHNRSVQLHGLVEQAEKTLASGYIDKDGDLLADLPPSNSEGLVDPDTLVVSYYQGDDEENQRIDWEGFKKHLSEVTGKDVTTQPYQNSADEIDAVKNSKIHMVVLHAADLPYLVNNAGFVPFGLLGSESGASGNHLTVATNLKSKIKKLSEIRQFHVDLYAS